MRWICAIIGYYITHSFWGALMGYLLGGMFSSSFTVRRGTWQGGEQTSSNISGGRDGFLYALMMLSAHVIHADGRIMHSEMETMRRFLADNFGEQTKQQGEQMILNIFEQKKTRTPQAWARHIQMSATQMCLVLSAEQRMQLVSYLLNVAKADGRISPEEQQALREVAAMLQLNPGIVDQLMGLGSDTLEDAYRVLGLTPEATDDEVRRAYKKMALENHPDRVASLGEDVRRAAEKKFKEINDAKERIYKSRGM